jgi:hypothetical protein
MPNFQTIIFLFFLLVTNILQCDRIPDNQQSYVDVSRKNLNVRLQFRLSYHTLASIRGKFLFRILHMYQTQCKSSLWREILHEFSLLLCVKLYVSIYCSTHMGQCSCCNCNFHLPDVHTHIYSYILPNCTCNHHSHHKYFLPLKNTHSIVRMGGRGMVLFLTCNRNA